MIKKLSKLFIILILMVLPNVVIAEHEYNHILAIEQFDISDSGITIGGYSYISHQDNYGIKNGIGNLRTYILIYKGSWNDAYANISTCNNNDNCFYKQADVVDDIGDMWWARCIDEGCLNQSESLKRATNRKLINDDACVGTNKPCLYSNVRFKKNIQFSDIISEFGQYDGEIGFRIVSNVSNNNDTAVVRTVNSGVAVHRNVCKVNGIKCSESEFVSGDYKFSLSDFATKVYYDAVLSIPRSENGARHGSVNANGVFTPTGYFLENKWYDIVNFKPEPGEISVTKGGGTGKFYDSIIQLDSETSPDDYPGAAGFKAIVPAGYTGDSGYGTSPYDYWTVANFVTIAGDLKLSGLKLRVKTVECGEVFGNDYNDERVINCGSNNNYNQCTSKEVSGTIYVKSISNSCQNFSNNGENITKVKINGVWYVPVKISTEVLFNQEATFTFGSITPNPVRAGKGFSLGETKYNNVVTWMNAKMYEDSNKPYYEYEYIDADSSCNIKDNLDINNISGNDKYCYGKDEGGYGCSNNLAEISLASMNQGAKSNIIIGDVAKSHIDEYISFISCDSNDSSGCYKSNPITDVGGSWGISSNESGDYYNNGHSRGRTVTQKFKYSLFNSYVALHGAEAGKVFYPNPDDELSYDNDNYYKVINKYYVDFKYASNTLPFDLNGESNPSFVNGMDWSLKGTCDVGVKEGYYDIPGPDPSPDPGVPNPGTPTGFLYKYRSISLSNPFPKGNIPTNWANWYGDITNQNRISGTYDNGVIYQYNLNKSSLAGGTSNDYSSMEGINKDGSSDFVDFGTSASNESYCEIGYFSDDCDK